MAAPQAGFWRVPRCRVDSKDSLSSSLFVREQNHSNFPLKCRCFSLQSGRVGPVDSGVIFHSKSKLGSFYFCWWGVIIHRSSLHKKQSRFSWFALTASKGFIKPEGLFDCWHSILHSSVWGVSAQENTSDLHLRSTTCSAELPFGWLPNPNIICKKKKCGSEGPLCCCVICPCEFPLMQDCRGVSSQILVSFYSKLVLEWRLKNIYSNIKYIIKWVTDEKKRMLQAQGHAVIVEEQKIPIRFKS